MMMLMLVVMMMMMMMMMMVTCLGLKSVNMSKYQWRNAEVVWHTSPTEISGKTMRGAED